MSYGLDEQGENWDLQSRFGIRDVDRPCLEDCVGPQGLEQSVGALCPFEDTVRSECSVTGRSIHVFVEYVVGGLSTTKEEGHSRCVENYDARPNQVIH